MFHLPFVAELPISVASMAIKDATGALTNIAENRGRGVLAGLLDSGNDLGQIAVQVSGAGSVLLSGLTVKTFAVITAMMVTSFFGTIAWTALGRRIDESD